MIHEWTVDYGDGPVQCTIPHAWRQDVPVSWEGPAIYSCRIDVPDFDCLLRFHGVSYFAQIFVNGSLVCEHSGMWTAFDVPLAQWKASSIDVQIHVWKNGGDWYPVRDVASGFLPFVFHTFGGVYGEVEIVSLDSPLYENTPEPIYRIEGTQIHGPHGPVYLRGLLHWGWYPDIGHPNPPRDVIEEEVLAAKRLGFNLIKFCLWVPPHRYLELLEEQEMFGWLELPLWDPTPDISKQTEMFREMQEIVLQYRHHASTVCWTVGCELSTTTSAEFRRSAYQMVKSLTGSSLVTDNSGGAEMYGGDPREFGDFYDFHPYCDTPFYPVVLDSLLPGPRTAKPTLLGEFNDYDAHRDLLSLAKEAPYWTSEDVRLNAQGVRWQHNLPTILAASSLAKPGAEVRNRALQESSIGKAAFIRKFVQEAVRARSEISGYVVTGIRDTPISTSGIFDDRGAPRVAADECSQWNRVDCLFLIPQRKPPWIRGGNRPGWVDPYNVFPIANLWKIGCHSEKGISAALSWSLSAADGSMVANGECASIAVASLQNLQVGEIFIDELTPGAYVLKVRFGDAQNEWPIWVPEPLETKEFDDEFTGYGPIHFLSGDGTVAMPFWRECIFEYTPPVSKWQQKFCNEFKDEWYRLLSVSPDCAIDPNVLPEKASILMNRIDTRTYQEHPILASAMIDGEEHIWTTLRPFGGLGIQPTFKHNPAGRRLLAILANL